VVSYVDIILGRVKAGERVAVIGTGGIGHDIAELLTVHGHDSTSIPEFLEAWGVDPTISGPGGLKKPATDTAARQVTMLQRSLTKPGARLGKSTGWIHRTKLVRRGVPLLAGCTYHKVDDAGLHYSVDGEMRVLPVDTVVMCAGQDPDQDLADSLRKMGIEADLIGGARFASELDAMRAIDEGTRLAYAL
jgi:2,4-dienoyl-CoA reductase (NADPH2)